MTENYSISDFYMYLKLGLWKSGEVTNLGWIERIASIENSNDGLIPHRGYKEEALPNYHLGRKDIDQYLKESYCKQMLANGIYLLDFYLQSKNNNNEKDLNIYIIVISTGRFGLEKREYTHVLKISSFLDKSNFISEIIEQKKSYRRKSVFGKRSKTKRNQFVPRKLTRTEI